MVTRKVSMNQLPSSRQSLVLISAFALALFGMGAIQRAIITETFMPKSGAWCFEGEGWGGCGWPPLTTGLPPFTPVPSATPTPTETRFPSQTPSATSTRPIATSSPTVTPLPPLLVNGGFEQPNHAGWVTFNLWRDIPSINDERGDPRSRFDGAQSLRFWNNFRCVMAGAYQQVTVSRFTTIEFSAWGRTWASDGVFPEGHDPQVFDGFAVGIDPSGGTSPASSGIIWNESFSTDTGARVGVTATSLASTVTVFLRGRVGVRDPNSTACEWPHQHMMLFIDGARLDADP